MKTLKFRSMALVAAVSTVFGVGAAYAATTTVSAAINFVTDLVITPVTTMKFGNVQAATAGTYTLSATTGIVTATGTGVTESGTPAAAAGDYLIKGSGTQTITISTSGYANSLTTTPSAATCKYGGGTETTGTTCDTGISVAAPTSSGTHLKLGLKVVTTGGADATTESPSFSLNVVYN